MRWLPASIVGAFVIVRIQRIVELLAHGTVSGRATVVVLLGILGLAIWLGTRPNLPGERFFMPVDARLAGAGLGMLVLAAAFAPVTTSLDPAAQPDPVGLQLLAPSLAHPFGTDQFSRDLFSRVIYGARVSLSVAVIAVLLAVSLGTTVGLVSGYAGGIVDVTLSRVIDAGLAIPRLLLLLVVLALWGEVTVTSLVLILGFTGWFGTARLVRAEVLAARSSDYVTAARGLGLSTGRVMFRHLLPNVTAPIIVAASLAVGHMILIEAGLSFLGFGVRPPDASWGTIIADGRGFLSTAPWIATIPGIAIAATVTAAGILGDRLQQVLNPGSAL